MPFLPAISVFINIYLMLMLDTYTWIRFGVWMILGKPQNVPTAAWNFHEILIITTTKRLVGILPLCMVS